MAEHSLTAPRRPMTWSGSRLPGGGLAERGLGGGKPRDRHAERRAGHVIEPDLVTEGDRGGIPAVLAANADLEIRPRLAPALDADPHQLPDALLVDGHEGITGRIPRSV